MQKNDVLEDKRVENQGHFGFGNEFLDIIPNTWFMKKKTYVVLHYNLCFFNLTLCLLC